MPSEAVPRCSGGARRRSTRAPSRRVAIRAAVRAHLDAISRIAAGDEAGGPIARLTYPERFHWLVAPASTIVQPSPVHTGLTDDPASELERLFERLVARPSPESQDG